MNDPEQGGTGTRGEVLGLRGHEPFGVGGRRECYVHPLDPDKCVKVLRKDDRRTVRIAKKGGLVPVWLRRQYDNNADEERSLMQLQRRLGDEMRKHFPACYGFVETDRGRGLVLDLVRDHDGPISRSIRELISSGVDLDELRPAFDEFGAFLLEHVVQTRNLHDHNMAARKNGDGSWRLVLIDGVGDPAWLPVTRWVRSFGIRRVEERIARAWPRMQAFAERGGVTPELREESSWDQGFLRHRGE